MRAKKGANTNEANAADRRQLVLRAAMNCFAVKGIQNSSMKDICAATGMRSGHIYYYFKNKEDIVEAAIELGLDNILARIEHMLDGEDIQQIHHAREDGRGDIGVPEGPPAGAARP